MGLIATLAALCLLLVTTMGALANTVNIFDKAGVLNTSQVQSEAANLPYPVNIYTMNANGSHVRQLTAGTSIDAEPTWTDSQQILLHRRRNGRWRKQPQP